MNILVVVNNLSGGGAEKVAVDLSNYFCNANNVSILTLSNKIDKYEIKESVKRIKLDLHSRSNSILKGVFANITRIFKLRKEIINTKPDVVISFMNRTNIRVLLSLVFTRTPVIITEHNYPKKNRMSITWEILRRCTYNRSKYLVSVSKGISDCFGYISEEKRKVIYNPVELKIGRAHV